MPHQEKITTVIQQCFPTAIIKSATKFSTGLQSHVYKVEINNPDKILAVKFFPEKVKLKVEKSAKISNYVSDHNIPSPHTYILENETEGGYTIMDCLPGYTATEVWETVSKEKHLTILNSIGVVLKRIHDLEIPKFWTHEKHEITSEKEWIEWTGIRINKYLIAIKEIVNEEAFDFLTKKFQRLQELYNTYPDFRFVPLHWDYHLSNINVDDSGEVSGVFDFDNAMKGHDMADLGQIMYWLIMKQNISNSETFEHLLNGYGEVSQVDREFIYLHSLLFLTAVMRSTWARDDLRWLSEQHLGVLDGYVKGEFLF
jgi:aminoglycoside phosphotransferase (APT) family kinase protein